jgi:hypothetical protein
MDDIATKLREEAQALAQNRRVAEYGPGGGNPNARASDHMEWKAADYIDTLERVLRKMMDRFKFIAQLGEVNAMEDPTYEHATRLLGKHGVD